MKDIYVFVEEQSAGIVVECIANKLGVGEKTGIIEHQGKQDLERSFPKKLRAWLDNPAPPNFIVLRDNDGAECIALKTRLGNMVPDRFKLQTKIRLVCQHLEAWYLGDLPALAEAGLIKERYLQNLSNRQKYRHPDLLQNAKQEFLNLHEMSGQMAIARAVGPHLHLENNRSLSFRAFVSAFKALSAVA